jgi:hypothetical protein
VDGFPVMFTAGGWPEPGMLDECNGRFDGVGGRWAYAYHLAFNATHHSSVSPPVPRCLVRRGCPDASRNPD